MMHVKTMALLSAAGLALVACGKTETTNTTTTDTSMTMSNGDMAANEAAPMANAAQTFINTAAASDAFEVASSKLALDTSKSPSTKAFANQMIKAHTASTAKLKALTAGMSPAMTPDAGLSAEQQTTLDTLKTKTGPDFDVAFAAAQVSGHQATLDALKAYAANGDVPGLKSFASGMVPTVAAHLNMAKGLK